mmetsp:Transcript_154005/g.266723  ORF Transcript_154005/g.266723 Transcript_154005/m.266723 type:complete len:582 (+) Transcript_154005:127-1872(+)
MAGSADQLSPGRGPTSDAALQLQQFVDEWYYRILHSSLAKSWDHRAALSALLDVFFLLGIPIGEKEALIRLEEESLVSHLAELMPEGITDQFEHIALQLQNVVHTATRVRKATEGDDLEVSDLFEEADGTGVFQQILNNAVVHSAKEVTKLRRVHASWRSNTEARLDRLLRSTADAEHALQQLLAIEAQLEDCGVSQNRKSKNFLMSLAEGQDKTLLKSVYSSWHGYLLKVKAENVIRDRFNQRIVDAENKLIQYKEQQMKNVRGVFMRLAMEEDRTRVGVPFKLWADQVRGHQLDAEGKKKLKEVESKLATFAEWQRENAKRVMARWAASNQSTMVSLCLQSWFQWTEDYKKDKELNDQIKRKEQELKAHLEAKKDEAKAVLNRMIGASDTGLMAMMMSQWTEYIKEEHKARQMAGAVLEADAKFKSLKMRQGACARGVQSRVNEQMNMTLCLRIFGIWTVETKAHRITNIFNNKYETKKRQLQGVKQLFKSFAQQLEKNLDIGEDDHSARSYTGRYSNAPSGRYAHAQSGRHSNAPSARYTGRSGYSDRSKRKFQHKGLNKGDAGTVSLPNINYRPMVA